VPLGLFVGHTGRGGVALVSAGNAIRALPTLGLVTFLFLLFTESVTSTIIGLVVLAVPPILAGTYAGLQATDHGVVDAAQGIGMTGWQRLWQVEVPISLKKITRQATRELERKIILKVLQHHHWNRKQAARTLNISYRALLYKIRDAGLPANRTVRRRPDAVPGSEELAA